MARDPPAFAVGDSSSAGAGSVAGGGGGRGHKTTSTLAPAVAEQEKGLGWRRVAGGALLLLASAGGAALLVWWALAFHKSERQLWMVPVGLVLVGTLLIAWLSVAAAGTCRRIEQLLAVSPAPPPPVGSLAVDPEREAEERV